MSINLFFLLLYNNMLTSSLTNIDDDWGNTKKKIKLGRGGKRRQAKLTGIENKLAFSDDYVKNSFLKYS